ncbi:MAG: flavohemoglobin expression-modulating QEGLA motif protein [Bacteriovorax sp.]
MRDLRYKNKILDLSLLLNNAQKPIQILDAVKWNEEIESFIIKNQFKELPQIDYALRPLKFDAQKKLQEFKELRLKISRDLGQSDALGAILIRNCTQYEDVVRMLMNRGKSAFYDYSKKLYGGPTEIIDDGLTRLSDIAAVMDSLLSAKSEHKQRLYEKNLTAEMVVDQLKNRLETFFANESIKIRLSDGIISDASAGSDYIKIKNGMMFSARDVDIFEVHEGWVHLGTTLNGQNQPFAKWLAKGPPCSTITQEGLAVTMELFNFSLFPRRAKRLNDRLIACQMAEDGANLLEVIEFFREKGQTDQQAIRNAGRVFRGANLEGGSPFTKDIAYLKGFLMITDFMRFAIRENKEDLIPFLFSGKVALEDLLVLHEFHQEGVISFPKYLPPQIRDKNLRAVSLILKRMEIEGASISKKNFFKKAA